SGMVKFQCRMGSYTYTTMSSSPDSQIHRDNHPSELETPLPHPPHSPDPQLTDSVPNTVIALHILLTLPVSVASGERSFSKLKLIKTYMRTSMLQQRLVGLSTLSLEHDIAHSIDLEELVSKFAKLKAQKHKF
uniref:HAT C-terminal dimerisation domain-containing protein n=1 Tax=Gopherus agassizii TaxID=38772 RepID=A0A452HJJ2_9SAUR